MPNDSQEDLKARAIEAIKTVYDPEIPVNIYELGLIYDVAVGDDAEIHVRMTLTTPNCPVAGILPEQVRVKLATLDGARGATVELVWDPPWTPQRMSEAAKLTLNVPPEDEPASKLRVLGGGPRGRRPR